MSNNQQTAVEWLIETMLNSAGYNQSQVDEVFAHALEMERQQSDQLRTERDELMKALERIRDWDDMDDDEWDDAGYFAIHTLNRMKEAGR